MSEDAQKEIRKVVSEIAQQLSETESKPRRQIYNIIEKCGVDFALEALKDTLEIEANGGMLTQKGDRRRTAGGVFFHTVRDRLPEDLRDDIFYSWTVAAKRRAAREAQYPPFSWEDRADVLEGIFANKGACSEVKLNLVGRPGEIERRQFLIVTTMELAITETVTFPGGVPQPPTEPTTYVVYISAKQWENVEEAIKKPEDELVIDGYFRYDPELQAIAVYTTYVTTKSLQRIANNKKQAAANNTPKKSTGDKADKKGGKNFKENKPARQKPQKQPTEIGTVTPATVTEELPEVTLDLPEGVPVNIAQKLNDLHKAAAAFRQKISVLENKPAGQQFGLEMTQKLLKNTEWQIEQLESQYVKK